MQKTAFGVWPATVLRRRLTSTRATHHQLLLAMKLLILFLTVGLLHVHANGVSQQITFSGRNVQLTTVFTAIKQQTGYVVFGNVEQLAGVKPATIAAKDMPLATFMETILKDQPLSFRITDKTIVVFRKPTPSTQADFFEVAPPEQPIGGRVTDSAGIPLSDATVASGKKRNAVTTGKDGRFAIAVIAGEVLTISYVGYEPQSITVTEDMLQKAAIGTIRLKEAPGKLNETVVTAYGIEKRTKELGYSVAKVSGEEIGRANSGNLLTGLIGKVSGLSITTQSSDMNPQMRILLRGIRSFGENSNNQPLFILNGSPLSFGSDNDAALLVMNFINNLNPADVEDVTIIKGANGTAMYGPEGVNGVILITTKKGTKGSMSVNFRSNNSFQQADFRKDYRQRSFGLGAGNIDAFGNGLFDPTTQYSWGPAYDGRMVPIGPPDENGNYQMVKYADNKQAQHFYDVARIHRNNLSLSQSDDRSSFYLGLGYTIQTGLLPGDRQNQATILLNTSRNMGKLTTQLNINYARTNDDRGPDIQGSINSLPTFIPILSYKDYQNDYWSTSDHYWNGISPYQQLAIKRNKSTTNALSGNLSFILKPLRWLTLTERPGINYSGYYLKGKTQPVYFSDYAHTLPGKYYDMYAGVSEEMQSNTAINNDVLISTIHQTGPFVIKTNFGNSIRQSYFKDLKASATLSVPVYNLVFAMYPSPAQEDETLARTISAFGNVLVGYKDKIFVELTGRNEWDSKRAAVARGKDLYMGINSSIVLNQVFPKLARLKWLSVARLRASFAQSANMNIAPYQFERRLGLVSGYPFNNGTVLSYAFSGDVNPNPLLKPEKVYSQEYGANLAFLNNKLLLDVVYYYQKNNSVILNVRNPFLTGAPSIDNAGSFQNHGFEFDLKLNPLLKLPNGFSLIVDGRLAINDNKVLSLSDAYNGVFKGIDGNGNQFYARTGHSAYEFAVRDWTRDPQGRVIVDKTSGMPLDVNYDAYKVYGKTLPKYTASMGLSILWKNFGASILADASAGNDHMFNTSTGFYTGSNPLTTINNRERYVFPNSSYDDGTGKYVANTDVVVSNVGQALYQKFSAVNAYGLVNAAFLKIREVSLQYKIPLKHAIIRDLMVSAYARDLFSFYPSSNINGDPGLIKGPGQRDFKTLNNNLTGGSSEDTALPGTVLYGFIVSFGF